jgi:hypothetical protein
MTKDNASGAGMETLAHLYRDSEGNAIASTKVETPFLTLEHELVSRTDATRLLAESQAHNAKLEAQVERLRALLAEYLDIREEAASIDDVLPEQSVKAWAVVVERQTALEIRARAALKP